MAESMCLRDIQPAELELVRSWRNAEANRRMMFTRHVISPEEHQAWWERSQDSPRNRNLMFDVDGEGQGVVSFHQIDSVDKNAAWGFYTSPEAPKGTGGRMLFLALDYAFGELGLHKLCSEVLSSNARSLGLHEKLGFTREGVLREQHRYEEAYMDVHRLGILRREWTGTRESTRSKVFQ